MSNYHINTKCIHSGWDPKNGESRQIPIVQSTTFKYESTEEMGKLFDLEASGYFYTRLQNPTSDAVAARIADLEGGVAAMLTSSGQAAILFSIINICEAGDHMICASEIYGGTLNLAGVTLKKFGIECSFISVNSTDEEIQAAIRPNTKLIFGESVSNPALAVLDIERFAKVAHANGIPLFVDNTFATPVNCHPFKWGADIIVHSTTKYMDGHAMQVGGCIVDSGNFDWDAHKEKFPGLTTPDPSYHGLVYTERFGKLAYITKATVQLMRDLGACPSPFNSYLLGANLETLPLRVERHCQNALALAKFLQNHDKISAVNYPGLENNPYYELAQKYMRNGICGVLSVELKGGREAAVRFLDNLKLATIATHVADAKTCVVHPASHTHRQLTDEQLKEAGISTGLVRLSIGIEHIDDLIADISQALDKA